MTELECIKLLEEAVAKARAAIEKEKEAEKHKAGSTKNNRKVRVT